MDRVALGGTEGIRSIFRNGKRQAVEAKPLRAPEEKEKSNHGHTAQREVSE